MSQNWEPRDYKLPKWAQTKLRVLRGNIDSLNAKLMQMEGDEATDTFFDLYYNFPESKNGRPLPRGTTVRFTYGMAVMSHFDCRMSDGNLEISGGDRLSISPYAANTISIRGHYS